MSNVLVGSVWHLDTVGVLSTKPVWVQRIVLFPNAASDAALFQYGFVGSTSSTYINSGPYYASTTVTGTNTIASTGKFTSSNVSVGDILQIESTSTGNNTGNHVVITRSDDNTIVTAGGLTNEASKMYKWTVFNGYRAMYIKAGASDASAVTLYFGDNGKRFPNLALYTLSTSATVDVYLKDF